MCIFREVKEDKFFKGKNEEDYIRALKWLSLNARINDKGGTSPRSNRQLLGTCPRRSVFVFVRLQWPLCKTVVFVESFSLYMYKHEHLLFMAFLSIICQDFLNISDFILILTTFTLLTSGNIMFSIQSFSTKQCLCYQMGSRKKRWEKSFSISYYFETEHVLLDKGTHILLIKALCFPFPLTNIFTLLSRSLHCPFIIESCCLSICKVHGCALVKQ